jgi:hypothetical protein
MRFQVLLTTLLTATVFLGGCDTPYSESPAPDYRVRLMTAPGGQLVAVPPECLDWRTVRNGALQNQPWPQFGCSQARNLAAMVEQPEDLAEGRDWGMANGEMAASTMKRYEAGRTMPLIDPNAKTPAAISSVMTAGEDKGGGGEGGTSSK